MSEETVISDEEGVQCPSCGKWNTHEECGTYEVWAPLCIHCKGGLSVING